VKAYNIRTMAEALGDGLPKELTAPPKKRSLFRKPTWTNPAEEEQDEEEEGVNLFSRAKNLYPLRIAEEERRRQKRLEKLGRKRSTASAERKASKTPDIKRRRICLQPGGHSSDSSPKNDHNDEPPWARRYVRGIFKCK
jgi:hypothetical protein